FVGDVKTACGERAAGGDTESGVGRAADGDIACAGRAGDDDRAVIDLDVAGVGGVVTREGSGAGAALPDDGGPTAAADGNGELDVVGLVEVDGAVVEVGAYVAEGDARGYEGAGGAGQI